MFQAFQLERHSHPTQNLMRPAFPSTKLRPAFEIYGTEGAESVVVSGGYPDDQDSGDEIIYTGQGGRDTSGKHVKDQELELERGNLALAKSKLKVFLCESLRRSTVGPG